MEKKIVYYSEFGAKGDGVTEDFAAIVKCHEYANENGCKVMADAGATYYIRETGGVTAIVKTDVDWGDATFIIDDSEIVPESPSRVVNIFTIEREHPIKKFGEDSDVVKGMQASCPIKAFSTNNVGYAPGYPAMIVFYDDTHSAYIRWGCHATGKPNPQRELVTVDKDGNIDKETVLLLDYNNVTRVEEYRIDDAPVTVEGGKFITIANNAPPVYTYYSRGIKIHRSNTVIKNVVHEIKGEGETGAPYNAFICPDGVNNLLCENLKLVSHKSYKDYYPDGTVHSIMGSYDIGGSLATNICYKNCVQTNYYKDEEKGIAYNETERWGIMGSNYCKNLSYIGCTLSRLDAHAGVFNVTVKDTTISYIKLTGGGTALIDNCKVISAENHNLPLVELRCDYGSTWNGEVIIKDTVFHNKCREEPVRIASALWNNWNFGYKTHLPDITLDNVTIVNPSETVYAFSGMLRDESVKPDLEVLDNGEVNLNPMDIAATVTVKGDKGYNLVGCMNPYISEKITINKI